MSGATVLFSEMSPDYDWEDDFNQWYDGHRIPERMEIPGFLSAQRYRDSERPNYLAVYELESAAVLNGEAYGKIQDHPNTKTRWILDNVTGTSRYIGNQISEQSQKGLKEAALDAPVLYAVFFSVPDARAAEFNQWYTEEHVPLLLKCKDWLTVRRFEIFESEPQPWTHLALHYLADESAFDSPEREAARNTEWRSKLAEEDWFRASYVLFNRLGERVFCEG